MKTKIIKLAEIVIDEDTQQRECIDLAMVAEYAESIQCGAKFPAVTVFFDGAQYWLADGYHRYHAHKSSGIDNIEADINDGTKDDAVMFSFGANGTHGKRLTNADKNKNVRKAISFHRTKDLSDRDIAKICHVTHPFVSKIRKEVVTVTTQENKPLNNKVKKIEVETVSTPKDNNEEDSDFDPDEYRLQELEETIKSLDEENTRLKDAIATNQIPDDIEIQSAEEIIADLRAQIKTLEATLASAETTRDTLYVKVRELESQCKWYQSKLKKSGLAQ